MPRPLPLLAILLLMLPATLPVLPASAGGYYNGYTTPAGYRYYNGFWYHGSQAYTRSLATSPGYYYQSGGYQYYQPGYSYYQYAYASDAPAYASESYTPPAPSTPAYSGPAKTPPPDWRKQLLEIVKERDRYEGSMRKAMQEQQAYTDTIKALGLEGNFRWQNYGASYGGTPGAPAAYSAYTPYAYRHQEYSYGLPYGSFGAQGSTAYGYSLNSLKEMYGETNMNTLYQQAARLTQGAQGLAGQAHGDFSALVNQAGTNQGRVAEILAKAAAAQKVLDSINAAPSSGSSTTISGMTPAPPRMPPAEGGSSGGSGSAGGGGVSGPPEGAAASAQARQFLEQVGNPLCGSCHSAEKAKGGFVIASYPTLPADKKRVVWERLLTDNKDKVMPPPPAGRLTPAQFQAFATN